MNLIVWSQYFEHVHKRFFVEYLGMRGDSYHMTIKFKIMFLSELHVTLQETRT